MKAKVIKAFYDLQDPARTVYQVGTEFEGTNKRVEELAKKGFVEVAAKAAETIEEKEPAKKPARRGAAKNG